MMRVTLTEGGETREVEGVHKIAYTRDPDGSLTLVVVYDEGGLEEYDGDTVGIYSAESEWM